MDNPTEIKAACGDIIAAFAHHVDHREFGDAVALFAEDGAFLRPDLEARGSDQIAALWADRPASFVTKHLCHASFFHDVGEESARAVTPFLLYTAEREGDETAPLEGPAAIAEYHDLFVKTDEGWRIAERRAIPIMLPRRA
ncbi:hypothetical protein Sj15T_38110 [Sphingobium sp. TA15]|uniref:SnoaL-like domain-containing protein n=1 Tax=Sphingobium indicum (strain DSM 16413 / CCM 7287 / MTCC 6362 / UT26 / NBRC 101211 / UT26S) TaxID=452662 RepID=D4Z8C2_SPHIU|nr:nuclear transport factor 2 family protein [Sphingobium indicum]BAI98741.1 hypothetical protein SJA_C2-03780 [Sphingobium indicum UT26S]BDD68790.1 hypothetical protein Sj15T_38110 [Sphingobium sp. TA15]